jgi:hypothetical protein
MASQISRVAGNLSLVVDVLAEFEALLDEEKITQMFEMTGHRLEQLNKEHSQNLIKFDTKFRELKSLEEFIKMKLEEVRAFRWKKYMENYNFKLSGRDIEAYIAGDEEYVTMYQIMLEVTNTKRKFEAVVEGLKNMGWRLADITKLRVAQIEAAVI